MARVEILSNQMKSYERGRQISRNNMALATWLKTGTLKMPPAAEDSGQSVAAKKSKTASVKFQKKWLTEFKWLRYDTSEGVVYC